MGNVNKTISTFIDISPIVYQTYDVLDREVIWSSDLACKILGYTKDELVKLSLNYYETIIHPDDLDASKNMIDKLLKSSPDEIIGNTCRFKKSDGSYVWVYYR